MTLWDRIQGIWSGNAHDELLSVLDEWRNDYAFDDEFQHVVELLESHILDEEYEESEHLFDEYYPPYMMQDEAFYFIRLLREAGVY